jgi:hypothetical protein
VTVQRLSDPAAELPRLAAEVRARAAWLAARPSEELLTFLDSAGTALAERATAVEGVTFLALWLRRPTLERLLALNLAGGRDSLDRFVEHDGTWVKAQPAGLTCHWVAGNVPTLALFSWALAVLTRNVALVRVSGDAIDSVDQMLAAVPAAAAPWLSTVRFVHFDRQDQAGHQALSRAADCKVVWGGAEAVAAVTALPRAPHCNEVVFGPRYSAGVIGRCMQDDPQRLREVVAAFVRDTLPFDQTACSSPQTIFIEQGPAPLEVVVDYFAAELEKAAARAPKRRIDPYTAARIYAARAAWALDENRLVRASAPGADWTVLADRTVELKEALQSRTLFLTAIGDVMEVVPLFGPRVQTIGMAIADRARALRFADEATRRGVSRCVRPGLMNAYDLPWDGRMVLSELVRWATVKP